MFSRQSAVIVALVALAGCCSNRPAQRCTAPAPIVPCPPSSVQAVPATAPTTAVQPTPASQSIPPGPAPAAPF